MSKHRNIVLNDNDEDEDVEFNTDQEITIDTIKECKNLKLEILILHNLSICIILFLFFVNVNNHLKFKV